MSENKKSSEGWKRFLRVMVFLFFLNLLQTCLCGNEIEEKHGQTLTDNTHLETQYSTNSNESNDRMIPTMDAKPRLLSKRWTFEASQHDLRKPVQVHDTYDQRRPVVLAADHDSRKPVPLHEGHDLRWEVPVEDTHDERSRTRPFDAIDNKKMPRGVCLKRPSDQQPASYDTHNKTKGDAYFSTWLCLKNSTMIPFDSYVKLENEKKSFSNETYLKRVCGKSWGSRRKRTVGGKKTQHSRWPWIMALLHREGHSFKQICSATVLNEVWAITAAHCVYGNRVKDIMVQPLKSNSRKLEKWTNEMMSVHALAIHPEFDLLTYENDLALLKFEKPLQFQANTIPVCLSSHLMDISGQKAVVIGWETSYEEDESQIELFELEVPVITNSECERMYHSAGYSQIIQDVFLCAGLAQGGCDACQGDSGGPMVIKDDRGQWTLIGLISWGIDCAAPNQPGVYTRITKFEHWIHDIIFH